MTYFCQSTISSAVKIGDVRQVSDFKENQVRTATIKKPRMAGSQCGAEVVAEGDRQGKNEPTYLTKSINQTINQTCPRGCNNCFKERLLSSDKYPANYFSDHGHLLF